MCSDGVSRIERGISLTVTHVSLSTCHLSTCLFFTIDIWIRLGLIDELVHEE
jgi:hypothetical protein